MKKLNKFVSSVFFSFVCFTTFFSLVGCKTVPTGNTVDPLELLDEKSGFYIAIPKAADPQLLERIVRKNIPNLSSKNVEMICNRTSKIYSGINRSKTGATFQTAIEGTIPTSLIPRLLTSNNGWKIQDFKSQNSAIPHLIYSANGINASFPSSNIVCIGRDLDYMLEKHDYLAFMPTIDALGDTFTPNNHTEQYTSDLPKEIYNYLKGAENEIRFFANKPKSFLTILTGTNLDLKLIDVEGSFMVDPKHSNQYILNIYFNFKENKYLKAGKALLNIAFGLTNSESELIGNNGLEIKGIKISKDTLYKILVL